MGNYIKMSNTLHDKLFHFEANPSDKVWKAIAEELDNTSGHFIEKLKAYQEAPPPRTWDRISQVISQESATVSPAASRSKYSKLLRYSTMAAAIFGAVILINLLTNKESTGDAGPQALNQSTSSTPRSSNEPGETPSSAPPALPNNRPFKDQVRPATPRTVGESAKPVKDRYLTMANDDGQTVRLSRKAYSVIDCAEKTAPASWSRCKENLQALQAKMATSIGAASGDFGSLIDMIKSLEEKQ